jgi:glutaredoxin
MSPVVLVGRAGCHLCDEARAVVASVCAATGTAWQEVDVDTDEALRAAYSDAVPVVLVDGTEHARFRVDPARLRQAVQAAHN